MSVKDPNRDRAGTEIRRLVREFEAHPWDINNGRCDEFATALSEALGPEAVVMDLIEWAHFCVKFHGRFYDAEEPYGVKRWIQLPLCVRSRRKPELPEPLW